MGYEIGKFLESEKNMMTNSWALELFFKDRCGSPMEIAFANAWVDSLQEVRVAREDEWAALPQRTPVTPLHLSQIDYVFPQYEIGKYRADFVLARVDQGWIEDPEHPGEILSLLEKLPLIVVEIDGHDFHEKTKEQAIRDKERDRFMTAAGYRVFRFTGSDIYNRVDQCVQEIDSAFRRMGSFYCPENPEWTRINNG